MILDFTLLDPSFEPLAQVLITEMEQKGYDCNPYFGIRTLQDQAKLYRQSRSTPMINAQIQLLRDQGCDYLANVLQSVGPQPTRPWATNALPGQSYHQFGLAMDCLLSLDGVSGTDDDYKIYADTAQSLGLTAGYYFKSVDMGHVQLGSASKPFGYTTKQINDHFVSKDAI